MKYSRSKSSGSVKYGKFERSSASREVFCCEELLNIEYYGVGSDVFEKFACILKIIVAHSC
jgi:hypothetical protein